MLTYAMVKDLWQLNREVAKVSEGEVRIANDLLWHMECQCAIYQRCHDSFKFQYIVCIEN